MKPYAYEYGKSNGDGTFSIVIERGEPKKPVADWPIKPLYLASAPEAPTGEIAGLIAERDRANESLREVQFVFGQTASALERSEAEAADLRRKLEEHQDAEDKAAREMATVIQGLRDRATAAERKLEEARKALEPFGRENDLPPNLPDETRLTITFAGHATFGDFRRARTLSGASE